ncbi:hypothetical protein BC830DRAFT_1221094 [Chytriomyces sp. MP71]|nr:hypothetical protein BC830DRAFT_1221094 [Chytriomyces sp. MP71]
MIESRKWGTTVAQAEKKSEKRRRLTSKTRDQSSKSESVRKRPIAIITNHMVNGPSSSPAKNVWDPSDSEESDFDEVVAGEEDHWDREGSDRRLPSAISRLLHVLGPLSVEDPRLVAFLKRQAVDDLAQLYTATRDLTDALRPALSASLLAHLRVSDEPTQSQSAQSKLSTASSKVSPHVLAAIHSYITESREDPELLADLVMDDPSASSVKKRVRENNSATTPKTPKRRPYNVYVTYVCRKSRLDGVDLDSKDVRRAWTSLTDYDKQPFVDHANSLQELRVKNLFSSSPVRSSTTRTPRTTGFNLFYKSARRSTGKLSAQEAGKQWRSMASPDRTRYNSQAAALSRPNEENDIAEEEESDEGVMETLVRKSRKRDPSLPARPKNPFQIYLEEMKGNADLQVKGERTLNRASTLWGRLSEEEKALYGNLSKEESLEYEKAMIRSGKAVKRSHLVVKDE